MSINDINSEIILSEYTPKDHQGFVDCINTFYKGGYPYLPYLESDVLEQHIKDGNMIITVAKTNDGKVVGTSAARLLDGAFENSVLLLLRCVSKDYRGKGIGSLQEKYLFSLIGQKFKTAESLYADVMTHDDVSQRTLCKNGFSLCGYRMMLYKNEIICPTYNFAAGTKMTQAIYCKALCQKKVNLFVPAKYRTAIKEIYSSMNIDCSFKRTKPDTSDIVYTSRVNELHKAGEIHISYSGQTNIESVLRTAEKIRADGNTCVVYINMNQAGCPDICSGFEKLGYVFSGIKPMSSCGEYLVMSEISNCKPNFMDIRYPEQNEKLSKYIFGGFTV